jgi:hypothetical protein
VYPRLMPICVGIMCEMCERVYLLVHPYSAKVQLDNHLKLNECHIQHEQRYGRPSRL